MASRNRYYDRYADESEATKHSIRPARSCESIEDRQLGLAILVCDGQLLGASDT